jgi:L-fuculose-phosphate aldolase
MPKASNPDFFRQSDEAIRTRLDLGMSAAFGQTVFSLKEKMTLACRLLADEGHARTLAGQVTVRDLGGSGYWTTGFGAGLAETTVTNLVRVDDSMTPTEGPGLPNPAVRFHLWIYQRRSDLNCIVHTHPPHCCALGLIGEPLAIAHMDATVFYDDCAFLPTWPGLPVANEEGQIIADALGGKHSILLAHHGMLTTGSSLEEALYLAVLLEHAAEVQLLARSTGQPIRQIDPALARDARDFMRKPSMISGTFAYWARRTLKRHPDLSNAAP